MALIVEDGSGIENADTWVGLEEATQYWTERSNARWIAADEAKREGALRSSADYLMTMFSWPGQPTTIAQRLPWPRAGVPSGKSTFPANAIPTQIYQAQLILAVEALGTDLLLRASATGQAVIEETKSAKGFSKTVKYAAPVDPLSQLVRFPAVEQILSGIATRTGAEGGFRAIPMRRQL